MPLVLKKKPNSKGYKAPKTLKDPKLPFDLPKSGLTSKEEHPVLKGKVTTSNILASICQDSFYDFLQEFIEVVVPEDIVWNWHIKLMCDEIQEVFERIMRAESKLYDVIFNISPGSTKSTIVSVAALPWAWTKMATFRALCGSYTHPLALELSRKSRDIVLSEKYQETFPWIKLREDQNTKGHFVNTKGGVRYAVGAGGSVTGMHGHALLIDDPIDPESANSEEEINSTNRWVTETFMTRKINRRITTFIMVMQRLNQWDPTGYILDRKGIWTPGETKRGKIKWFSLPADYTEQDQPSDEDEPKEGDSPELLEEKAKRKAYKTKQRNINPPELIKFYKDRLIDPERLSKDVLDEAHEELGAYGYAGQYRQNPVPRGGGLFKTDKLLYKNANDVPKRWKRVVRYWDKAATPGSGKYSAGVLMGKDFDDNIWILDVVRGQWGVDDRDRQMLNTARADKRSYGKAYCTGIEQEPGSGGKESAGRSQKKLREFRVHIDKVTGDKMERAKDFALEVNNGCVIVLLAPWTIKFEEELRFAPFGRYVDQIDCCSGGYNILATAPTRVGALA